MERTFFGFAHLGMRRDAVGAVFRPKCLELVNGKLIDVRSRCYNSGIADDEKM